MQKFDGGSADDLFEEERGKLLYMDAVDMVIVQQCSDQSVITTPCVK